jgi:hypothetical protein
MTLATSANPAVLGQAVTLTVSVSPSSATLGRVTYYDGAAIIGTTILMNGAGAFTTRLLGAGVHSLKVTYTGDAVVLPSTSNSLNQTVNTTPVSSFPTVAPYLAGIQPLSVTAADVNGDGTPDLIVANYFSSSVSVFLGNADGTFQPALSSAAGPAPYAIAVGDFNFDGRLDVVAANFNEGSSIYLMLGNGDGTFQAPVSYTADRGPRSITVADLDGDGKLDIVVGNSSAADVSVLLGNGDGTFRTAVNYGVAGGNPSGVAVADITGDGKPDIVVSDDAGGSVWVLAGFGDGTFPTAAFHGAVGSGPRALALGDFNGDGKLDIAVANSGDGTVGVLLSNGGGSFQPVIAYHLSSSPSAIAVGDTNGDGRLDIVVADGNNISILAGNGNGTFQAPVDFPVGGPLNSVTLGEFNGDGATDIATTNNGFVNVLLGQPALPTTTVLASSANPSVFGQSVTLTATVSSMAATGSVTFFDGGAVLSVQPLQNGQAAYSSSVLSYGAHSVKALYNGDGTFGPSSSTIMQTVGGPLPAAVLSSSANPSVFGKNVTLTATITPATAFGNVTFYDGSTVLGSRPISGGRAVLTTSQLAAGVRTLKVYYAFTAVAAPPTTTATLVQTVMPLTSAGLSTAQPLGSGSQPYAVVTGDFTGVGNAGIAFTNFGGRSVSVLNGNGNGTFRSALTYEVGANPVAIGVADFNQDGRADLVVVNKGSNNVHILLGVGDGTFIVQSSFAVSTSPSAVAVADFNGDGKPDIAVSNQGDANVSIFLGNGDGTFQSMGRPGCGPSPSSIAAGDVNGDGKVDLVVTNFGSASVYASVLLGNGDGTFQAPASVAGIATKPVGLALGDFNGDGKLDLAVSDQASFGVFVFIGNGNGTFKTPVGYGAAAGGSVSIGVGDLNGDGKIDLAVANQTSNNVSVFLGNGDGTFQTPTSYPTGAQPTSVAVNDFDQDGRTDLVVANQGSGNLSLLLALAPQLKFATQPTNVAAGSPLPAITVQVLDANGNVDTTYNGPVNLSSAPGGINALVNASKGIAMFTGLVLNANGTYTLVASAVGYRSGTSNSFTVTAVPTVSIETPVTNSIFAPGLITVSGWALESTSVIGTAISLVQVSVDGVLAGTATYGLSRADVCGQYPGRPGCPNVGFTFQLNAGSLSNGVHVLTVSATDSSGSPGVGSSSVMIGITTLMMTGTRVGIYRQGVGFLEDSNGNGIGPAPTDANDRTDAFAPPGGVKSGDIPVVGDWNGDGHKKAGFYRPSTGTWWLDVNNDGMFNTGDATYQFGGVTGDVPVVGDWIGIQGVVAHQDCIGVFRSGFFWVLDLNCNGSFDGTPTDAAFPFGGQGGDVPVVGAWSGGLTHVGVVRKYAPNGVPQGNPFFWVMDAGQANAGNDPQSHQPAAGSYAFGGLAGDIFFTGDWNHTGISRAGVYRSGLWLLDINGTHNADLMIAYGGVLTDVPLPGSW